MTTGVSSEYSTLLQSGRNLANRLIAYGCSDIESDYSITADQLTTWNTWLSSNCDTDLYAGFDTDAGDTRPVCVNVNASAPVGTANPSPSSTPPQTGTKTATSMGPTQTGVVAGCQEFYSVQSGDTCANIETTYDISFQQLYQWNPSSMSSFPEIIRTESKLKHDSRKQL